jgi:hypothetical protein
MGKRGKMGSWEARKLGKRGKMGKRGKLGSWEDGEKREVWKLRSLNPSPVFLTSWKRR